jgi:hypothetical protein
MSPTEAENTAKREDVNRLSDKIDILHTVFVTRNEYTTMHSAISALISTVATQVTNLSNQVEKNRETVDRGKDENNRWLLQKFEAVETRITKKLDEQNETSKNSKQWLVGLLYGTASSVVVGLIIVIVAHFWH